jgi:recombinational DNA repair protein RecT
MSVEDVEAHAKKYDPKAKKGPFGNMGSEGRKHKHFIPYGLKTAIHQLANRKLDLNSDWQLDDSAEREAKKQIKIDDRSFRPEAPAIESEIESELPEPNWDEVGAEVEAKQRGNVNDDS